MPEFLRLSAPDEALQTLLNALADRKSNAEVVNTASALGRVTTEDIRAPHPLPEFSRSSVDGYAVRARDTFGVSESLPGFLTLIGEAPMGEFVSFGLLPGTCALIHTGGMLPEQADAVVMLEYTQVISPTKEYGAGKEKKKNSMDLAKTEANTEIEISRPVAEGENIIHLGEDVAANQVVIRAGKRIRPVEIGGCMALGITKLRVATTPKIGIISSGDEIVPPQQRPAAGQVRDVNSYSLAAMVEEAGGEPKLYGIVPDNLEVLKSISMNALADCDAVVITAGSSASIRDITAEVIRTLGSPGVLIHGVNVRPGKPTILAVCGGKAVIGLPGNPVSALVVANIFVVPVIEKLLNAQPKQKTIVQAKLTVNVASQAGREDWVAVRLKLNGEWKIGGGDKEWMAIPVFGKSNLIFGLAAADGFICIPPDATGFSAGEIVAVALF